MHIRRNCTSLYYITHCVGTSQPTPTNDDHSLSFRRPSFTTFIHILSNVAHYVGPFCCPCCTSTTAHSFSSHRKYHRCCKSVRVSLINDKTYFAPKNMPFKYANSNKGALGAKVAVFLISGFSIPFVAAYYQR